MPGWFASIVQVPAIRNVAVVAETVQTVVLAEVNVTGRPEVAVAISVRGVPTDCVPGLLKVMVCAVGGATPNPLTVTVPVLLSWSVPVTFTLSLPPALGVKLTDVGNVAPPLTVEAQVPPALTVAVAVALEPATNDTDGAGVAEQLPSFRMVVTGFKVDDGLTAVPTGELGTVTLSTVICPTVSPPEPSTLEYTSKYRLPWPSRVSNLALWVETV